MEDVLELIRKFKADSAGPVAYDGNDHRYTIAEDGIGSKWTMCCGACAERMNWYDEIKLNTLIFDRSVQ
jgi:hypothetical protein